MRCPLLTDDKKCSIYYQERPNCCVSYPNRKHPKCVDAVRCDLDCANCKDVCCENITVYEGMTILESLNVSCDECKQCWTKD